MNARVAADPAAGKEELKAAFGGNVRLLTSGGAPLPLEIADFYARHDLPILQAYKPLLKYRVGAYVDFLDKFMAEIKIERVSLVGSGFSVFSKVKIWISKSAINFRPRVRLRTR